MADVALTIGGRSHRVACRDGEEAHLEALGRRLDAYSAAATRAAGAAGGERALLFIALMLADELVEAERTPARGDPNVVLDRIADALESLADTLENGAATS